jgi:Ras-related protein Rab-6A
MFDQRKVVLLGHANVGKSSLVQRAIRGTFTFLKTSTIGVQYDVLTIRLDSGPIDLQIWDTMGDERYHDVVPAYVRDAQAVLLVCSAVDECSMEKLGDWLVRAPVPENAAKFIVISKADLALDPAKRDHALEILEDLPYEKHFCSSKTGEGVRELFFQVAATATRRNEPVIALVEGEKKWRC